MKQKAKNEDKIFLIVIIIGIIVSIGLKSIELSIGLTALFWLFFKDKKFKEI